MNSTWNETPAELELSEKYIDIWRTALNLPRQQVDDYRALLSAEEVARANRFKVERKYREYIISRGLLRRVLGHTLKRDPAALVFDYTKHDKPVLAMNRGGAPVCFNVSHSHELTLIAVTLKNLIGIDVEHVRRNVEFKKLAKRYFSPHEAGELDTHTDIDMPRAFFSCWTRKEAYVKALGDGIAFGLNEFSVSVNPSDTEVSLSTHRDRGEAEKWSILNLQAGPEYTAALAVAGRDYKIRCWEYRDSIAAGRHKNSL